MGNLCYNGAYNLKISRVRWGGMGIKTGIFEMIIKLFKFDIQQLKNDSRVFTFLQYTSHIHSYYN